MVRISQRESLQLPFATLESRTHTLSSSSLQTGVSLRVGLQQGVVPFFAPFPLQHARLGILHVRRPRGAIARPERFL